MLWLVLILVAIGAAFYLVDKKIKEKYKLEEKFNLEEWTAPELSPVEDNPQALLAAPVPSVAEKITYKKKDSVLNVARETFYNALETVAANRYNLLTNINAADVLEVISNGNSLASQIALKNMAGKQFDFIFCDKRTLAPLCVIALDEALPLFLSNACENAQLPVVIFRLQQDYDVEVLREKISQAVDQAATKNGLDETREATASDALEIRSVELAQENNIVQKNKVLVEKQEIIEQQQEGEDVQKKEVKPTNGIDLKFCPHCSAVMLKRKAKSGANAGKLFWICSTYPACRGMRAV